METRKRSANGVKSRARTAAEVPLRSVRVAAQAALTPGPSESESAYQRDSDSDCRRSTSRRHARHRQCCRGGSPSPGRCHGPGHGAGASPAARTVTVAAITDMMNGMLLHGPAVMAASNLNPVAVSEPEPKRNLDPRPSSLRGIDGPRLPAPFAAAGLCR